MKQCFILLGISIVLISAVSCNRQNRAVIKGRVESAKKGDKVYLEELMGNKKSIKDSSNVNKSGRFHSTTELEIPGFYQLTFKSGPSLSMILSPGEKIDITADMSDFYRTKKIEGSLNSIRVNVLHDSLRTVIKALNKIREQYAQLDKNGLKDSDEGEELTRQFIELKNNYHRKSVTFILEDLTALSNIAALYQEYAPNEYVFNSNKDIQFFKLVSDSLTKYYPDVRYVKTLRQNYLELYNNYNTKRILQKADTINYNISDLHLPGPEGKNIALSSLKGKLVLLLFWSVTQPESIRNSIELKEVYTKYHKAGFEIYQVALNNTEEVWKRSLAFEEIPWISVCDTSYPNSKTLYLYNVTELPMNYLIDRGQTEIIAKNVSAKDLDKLIPFYINR